MFRAFTREFPGYGFTVTEGRQVQEILIGVRDAMFEKVRGLKRALDRAAGQGGAWAVGPRRQTRMPGSCGIPIMHR